tara:strand:- start:4179 stop:4835 length:657 start_codon:yes stop_codon:yes gene_type:complete
MNVFAFKLSPMKAEFGHKGKGATRSFRIINDTPEKIKVEAEIMSRNIDLNNNETRSETDLFTLYPPQLEVEAGKSKVIRVSYIGDKESVEKAYRLIVRQFPSDKKPEKSGGQINILFEYVASLYVTPKDARPNLKIKNAKKLNNSLSINFVNEGNKHTLLKNYRLNLKQGKKSKTIDFTEEKYKNLATQNILAGLERKIIVEDDQFKVGKIEAKFVKK